MRSGASGVARLDPALSIIAPSVNVLRRTRRKPFTIRAAAPDVVIGQSTADRAGARPYQQGQPQMVGPGAASTTSMDCSLLGKVPLFRLQRWYYAVANLYPSLHCRWNALTEKGPLNRRGPGWLVGCSYGDVKIGDRDAMCWVVTAPPATWKKYLRPSVHVTFRWIPAVSPIAADESGG